MKVNRGEWCDAVTFCRDLSPTEARVAHAVAAYVNAKTDTAWPAIAKLASRTGLSERTVQRALGKLVDTLLLSRVRQGGGRGNNGTGLTAEYRLTLPPRGDTSDAVKGDNDDTVIGDTGDTPKGDIRRQRRVTPVTPEPSYEPSDKEEPPLLPPPTPPAKAKKGTRLPAEWRPPPDSIDLAFALGLTRQDFDHEADRFRDYWIAIPGAKGVKLDWDATWRNWLRRAADDRKSRPSGQRAAADRAPAGGLVAATGLVLADLAREEAARAAGGGHGPGRPGDDGGDDGDGPDGPGASIHRLPPRSASRSR